MFIYIYLLASINLALYTVDIWHFLVYKRTLTIKTKTEYAIWRGRQVQEEIKFSVWKSNRNFGAKERARPNWMSGSWRNYSFVENLRKMIKSCVM